MSLGPYLIVYSARASNELFCFWAGSEGEAREKFGAIAIDGAATVWIDGEDARDVPISYVALVKVMMDFDQATNAPRGYGEGSDDRERSSD